MYLRCPRTLVGTPLYGFDVGPDPIVMENVGCTGMEPTFSSCPSSPINNSVCLEPNRAAGVTCTLAADSCIDDQVRLVDGPAFYEGRLEVCMGNQWFSVCDAGFDMAVANTVCNDRLFLVGSKYICCSNNL